MPAALVLLSVGTVAGGLTGIPRVQPARRPLPRVASASSPSGAPQHATRVSSAQPASPREVARTFLAGYLPLAYGRGEAKSVRAVTPALRSQLMSERTLVAPAELRRQARVVSLVTIGRARGLVVATALLDDGGIANYALQMSLREWRGRWLVSAIDRG